MGEQEGIAHPKKDFSDWYNDVVLKGELADFSAVKGFWFIKPYGYAIWERVQATFNGMIKASGHQNAFCPSVFPEKFLKKEKEHLEGFAPEVFFITHAGDRKLEERLVLKPTGETVIYDAYSKWIRSWRDLPVLYNYWNSNFRAEIKATKLFLRTAEFLWQEGHTAHATEAEAWNEVLLILKYYRTLSEDVLAIPVLEGKKSEAEKFPGAAETTTLEAMMPSGKALQMGTSHHLGQHFSKPFNISFLDKDQKKQFVWTTSWGVTTRLIGAVVMMHGDDKGLVLPPKLAPTQVVIVPIFKEKTKKSVLKEAEKLTKQLSAFRTSLDDRDGYTPGWKFNHWEMKGVPLRVEIGPKDIQKKHVVLVRRDTGKKEFVPLAKLEKTIDIRLKEIQSNLFQRAKKFLKANTHTASSFPDLAKAIEKKKGFLLAGWCGSTSCEEKVKEKTTADIRIIPFKPKKGKCILCGKRGKNVYFAKAY